MTTLPLPSDNGSHSEGDFPKVRLPNGRLFADRARRLRHLAPGHSLEDFLRFAAALADSQQAQLDTFPQVPPPSPELLRHCLEHRMPPVATSGWSRHPAWRQALSPLAEAMQDQAPAQGREICEQLSSAEPAWLEDQAERLLAGSPDGLDLGAAPLIGAALQVYWTGLALTLDPTQIAPSETPDLCPVCGSPPVAGVVRIGAADNGLRYLHCALCNSEWHLVRAQCSHCGSDKDIGYYSIEGRKEDPVRAEACPACHSYLKICHMDKDPLVDPQADDLASLGLDLLLGEQGYAATGVNFLLLQGVVQN